MLSIVERQGPERLESLASTRNLPGILSMPDVAVILARELVMSRPPPDATPDEISAAFMDLVLVFVNMLTHAVLTKSLSCGAKYYRADETDTREQYSMSVIAWPWLEWTEIIYDYLLKVRDYADGKILDKPTLDRENGLVDVRIARADFRSWCERQRLGPLPAAWFTDAEMAEHIMAISKPTEGARAANARFDGAREFARQTYLTSLAEDAASKPGSHAKFVRGVIERDLQKFKLTSAPTVETIKGWIIDLAPPEVRRPGRPRK